MAIEFLCKKLGMTRLFQDDGSAVAVTVLEAGPNTVIQKKDAEKDGYVALQLGFQEKRPSRTVKALQGHFDKAGVGPKQHLAESPVNAETADAHEVGTELKVDLFEQGQRVDVIGTSKGRGFTGVVKRHNFAIKRRTHGTHEFFRHAGAIGAGAYPGKVIKGMKMAGQHGNARTTTRNLVVAKVDADRNLLYLQGSVPGHVNGIVRVRQAVAPH